MSDIVYKFWLISVFVTNAKGGDYWNYDIFVISYNTYSILNAYRAHHSVYKFIPSIPLETEHMGSSAVFTKLIMVTEQNNVLQVVSGHRASQCLPSSQCSPSHQLKSMSIK